MVLLKNGRPFDMNNLHVHNSPVCGNNSSMSTFLCFENKISREYKNRCTHLN